MKLNCYHCKTAPLAPAKLDDTLPALVCQDCDGAYLDLLNYRVWLENHPSDSDTVSQEADALDIEKIDNSDTALVCQRCHKFMMKYRINNDVDNTINVCNTCDDVWLDGGEWQLLRYLNVQDKLTDIMGEPWQKQLRDEAREQSFQALYQEKFGEDFADIDAFAQWLKDKPNKSEILHYLSQRS